MAYLEHRERAGVDTSRCRRGSGLRVYAQMNREADSTRWHVQDMFESSSVVFEDIGGTLGKAVE